MSECDHCIGVRVADDGGFLRASERVATGERLRADFQKWAANPIAAPSRIAWGAKCTNDELVAEDYEMFAFCPDCGTKL